MPWFFISRASYLASAVRPSHQRRVAFIQGTHRVGGRNVGASSMQPQPPERSKRQRRRFPRNRRCRIRRRDSAEISPCLRPFHVSVETQSLADISEISADMRHSWRISFRSPMISNVCGGPSRNRTGVNGFAVRCVTTPPSGPDAHQRGRGRLAEVAARRNGILRPRRARKRVGAWRGPTLRAGPEKSGRAGHRRP